MKSFLEMTILTLYGDAFSPREEFLILRLFQLAMQHEISVVSHVSDFLQQETVVPKMIVTYNRRKLVCFFLFFFFFFFFFLLFPFLFPFSLPFLFFSPFSHPIPTNSQGLAYIQRVLGPVMNTVLEVDRNMELSPMTIYIKMINTYEIRTGEKSKFDRQVSPEQVFFFFF